MRTERFFKGDIIDVGGVRLGVLSSTRLSIPDSVAVQRTGKVVVLFPKEPIPSVDNFPITADNTK